jgi:hypothetical protein
MELSNIEILNEQKTNIYKQLKDNLITIKTHIDNANKNAQDFSTKSVIIDDIVWNELQCNEHDILQEINECFSFNNYQQNKLKNVEDKEFYRHIFHAGNCTFLKNKKYVIKKYSNYMKDYQFVGVSVDQINMIEKIIIVTYLLGNIKHIANRIISAHIAINCINPNLNMKNYDVCIYILYERMDLDFDDGIITNNITADDILNFCKEIRKPVDFIGFLIYLFHDKKNSKFTMMSKDAFQKITCESNIKSNIPALENIREQLKSCEEHEIYVNAIWTELNFDSQKFNSNMYNIFVIPKDLKFDNMMICNNTNNYGLKLIDLDDAYFYINEIGISNNNDLVRLQNMYLQDFLSPYINSTLKKLPIYKQSYINFLSSYNKIYNDINIVTGHIKNKTEIFSIIEKKINNLKHIMMLHDDAYKLIYFLNVLYNLSIKMQNEYGTDDFKNCLNYMFNIFFNNWDDDVVTIFINNAKKINEIKEKFNYMIDLFNKSYNKNITY